MADFTDYFIQWSYPERYKIEFILTEAAGIAIHADAAREAEMLSSSSWQVESDSGYDPLILNISFSAPRALVVLISNMNVDEMLSITLFPETENELDLGQMEYMAGGSGAGEYTVFPISPTPGASNISPLQPIIAYAARADLEIPDDATVTMTANTIEIETTTETINPYLIKITSAPTFRYDSYYKIAVTVGE